MTADVAGSTVPRRSLGAALRAARERAELTMRQAAAAIEVHEQSIRRIEQGTVSSRPLVVEKLCQVYGVDHALQTALVGLARESKSRGWWHAYGDIVPAWFELFVGLEATASRLRMFDPLIMTGLLQSAEYMTAVIRAELPDASDKEIAARIKLRQSRQQLLARTFPTSVKVEAIIAESVLLANPGKGVMRAQLEHLLQAVEAPTVSVRILPIDVGPHRGTVAGAFTMLDFPSVNGTVPPATIYSESLTGALYLDKPSEFAAYELAWAALGQVALDESASAELMSHMMKENQP